MKNSHSLKKNMTVIWYNWTDPALRVVTFKEGEMDIYLAWKYPILSAFNRKTQRSLLQEILLVNEVNVVVRVLRENDIPVTTIHNYILKEVP